MDWKDVGNVVAKAAPLLGTLVGGPAGTIIGGLIASVFGCDNTPDAIHQAVLANPDAAIKLAQIEADNRVQLQQLAVSAAANDLAADTARIQAVNATMQAEAKSEHWLQWSWRPLCGLTFCVLTALVYFALPLAKVPVPAVPETVWMAFLAILGVASWHRGTMQVERVKTANKK
jgi:hypothetical protein